MKVTVMTYAKVVSDKATVEIWPDKIAVNGVDVGGAQQVWAIAENIQNPVAEAAAKIAEVIGGAIVAVKTKTQTVPDDAVF